MSSVFLSSELQAAQILKSRQVSDTRRRESPANQQLVAMCQTLKLPEPRGQSAAAVFSQVQNKVGSRARGQVCQRKEEKSLLNFVHSSPCAPSVFFLPLYEILLVAFLLCHFQVEERLKDLPNGSVGSPVLKKSLSNDQWVRK